MAYVKCNSVQSVPSSRFAADPDLMDLTSELAPMRQDDAESDFYRLIVDGSLLWALRNCGSRRSWRYLAAPVHVRQIGRCFVITAG